MSDPEGGRTMTSDKTENNVWLDEKNKIASFHPVHGYHNYTCQQREQFLEFLKELAESGYRFQ